MRALSPSAWIYWRSLPAHRRHVLTRGIAPAAIGVALLLVPVPAGLPPRAWYYFALFAAVIVGITTEPIPAPAVGLAGVIIAAMSGLVHQNPAQSIAWALSGFSNSLAWLVFASMVLAAGYEKTGLGRRIALWLIKNLGGSTLGLGYVVALADLAIAPFTPSNVARSAGTIYPVIRNIPALYGSAPGATGRRMGGYLMYTALAATCVTSSMFPTAFAANLLAVGLIAQTVGVSISWREWVLGFLPVGLALVALVPALVYWLYPPEVKRAPHAPGWAAAELAKMGRMSVMETMMLAGVLFAVSLWVGGSRYTDATTAAIFAVVLLITRGIVSWDDVVGNKQAWSVFVWFSTLVTLAGGLVEVQFVPWLTGFIEPALTVFGFPAVIGVLVVSFFLLHYLFATVSGHAAALLPVFLSVAVRFPGASPKTWALILAFTLGLMGILTPYATGPSPLYYSSGFIRHRDFWLGGLVMGAVFLLVYLLIGIPWLLWRGAR
ncbi:MAG TPA: DASS family sodium-coupled anion symporter [Candidatus Methylomirabilis sp.]|nr:DASS family sodium-coupled anion symporter [Candidatus Methylomirabilis sp.]